MEISCFFMHLIPISLMRFLTSNWYIQKGVAIWLMMQMKMIQGYILFFNKLYSGDNYLLAEFSTAFPKTLLESFKMRGNALMTDPEYLKAMETYGKSKYILVDTKGNQAAISELPREGSIQYMDADNVIYIKPKEDVESDFNVFYRYRVSLRQP